MGPRLKRFLAGAGSRLAGLVMRAYFLTIRIHEDRRSAAFRRGAGPRRAIYALWHSQQLLSIWHYRGCGAGTLASAHRDAEYPARAAMSLGYRVVRGSSTNGSGRAYRELLALAGEGRPIALTTDGPRGPRHVVKVGVIRLAAETGVPVIPLAIGHSSCWTVSSWDGFRIPKPFSRGYALWGDPVRVAKSSSREEQETARLAVEEQLLRLTADADVLARGVASGNGACGLSVDPGEP